MRHHLHIFFPGLWLPKRSQQHKPYHLTEHERAIWYENGFRPAIVTLLGQNITSEWPARYSMEQFRAQRTRGGFAWGTKLIPKDVVDQLANRIRVELDVNPFIPENETAWARDFFILHTIRGTKHSSYHRVNVESAEYYLYEFVQDSQLSSQVPEVGVWYINVGIEISSDQGECLQWMTATHYDVIQQALHISDAHAQRI